MTDHVFVIAEAGVNHNGSIEKAKALIEAAKVSGADAVKFQTFRVDEIATDVAPKATYQTDSTGAGSQREMLLDLELSYEAHRELKEFSDALGIEFMSTAFDLDSLKFLVEDIGIKRIKIPSGEITNLPLLLAAGATQLPLIISTGMADMGEITQALIALNLGSQSAKEWVAQGGSPFDIHRSDSVAQQWRKGVQGFEEIANRVIVLHCTTQYPAPLDAVNLRAMETMREELGVPIGYSDHTLGVTASVAAVARCATVIEKHLTLDRSLSGPDHLASLEPNEFATMIRYIREVTTSLGAAEKVVGESEHANRYVARRSLVAKALIGSGDEYTLDNVAIKRPGLGISPMDLYEVVGQSAPVDLEENEQIPPTG